MISFTVPSADEAKIVSCTILTTGPNELMKPIHDRVPVILPDDVYGRWLDPEFTDKDELQEILRPFDAKRMDAHPVSRLVNLPSTDDERCVRPL